MKMRQAILAAIRRDPDLVPKVTGSLRERIDEEKGPMSTVVQAAGALEPILADAVRKRPSKLGKIGLKSAHMLANLAMEDSSSNSKLAGLADGSTVGIVFVDIAGFLAYTASHGDDAARHLLGKLDKMVDTAIKPVRGETVKTLGDGYLLAFPSASQAVRGGVTLNESVGKVHRRGAFPVNVRIAVHAGEPLVEEDDLLGHDVNLTARLLDHCEPGEVVVSEAAKDLAARRLKKVAFGNERDVKVRGLAGRVRIFSVNPGGGSVVSAEEVRDRVLTAAP
ncbi:MAG: adenylate/guanylate cyclase domain-containing protein [Actinomycetota bacterium]|nr:adenylate/guanylate cyclase domain-containing protein [Actinomycetota bacterium]